MHFISTASRELDVCKKKNMLPVNHHLFLERRKGFLKLPNMHGSIMKKLASKLRPNHGSKTHFLWGLKT